MGAALVRVLHGLDGIVISGGLVPASSVRTGQDLGEIAGIGPIGLRATDDVKALCAASDGFIDFTTPAASLDLLAHTGAAGLVHVIGTTGFDAEAETRITKAAQSACIVKSGNMSLGVNLLAALVKQAATTLGEDFDIEIVEMHHRHKVDAPSGTALMLGRAAAEGRAVALDTHAVYAREGITGPRVSGIIGFATLRGGSVVGDHSVVFAGLAERIELGHRAENRDIFARGAARAALWAHGKPPGLYSMADVLGLFQEEDQ